MNCEAGDWASDRYLVFASFGFMRSYLDVRQEETPLKKPPRVWPRSPTDLTYYRSISTGFPRILSFLPLKGKLGWLGSEAAAWASLASHAECYLNPGFHLSLRGFLAGTLSAGTPGPRPVRLPSRPGSVPLAATADQKLPPAIQCYPHREIFGSRAEEHLHACLGEKDDAEKAKPR